jgi:hypothetical protein
MTNDKYQMENVFLDVIASSIQRLFFQREHDRHRESQQQIKSHEGC